MALRLNVLNLTIIVASDLTCLLDSSRFNLLIFLRFLNMNLLKVVIDIAKVYPHFSY
jgi:hypothetical protein